jgi:hypothetical protein
MSMNLLPAMILYLAVGCGEWYLALRRTLACARGEKALLVFIVFIENLLGLWVLSNFIRTNNWFLALSYSTGAAAGALIMTMDKREESAESAPRTVRAIAARLSSRVQAVFQTTIPCVFALAGRVRGYRPHLFVRRALQHTEHPE